MQVQDLLYKLVFDAVDPFMGDKNSVYKMPASCLYHILDNYTEKSGRIR